MDWSLDPLGYVDYAHGDHVSEGWRKHLLEVFKHDSEVCDSIKSYPDEIFWGGDYESCGECDGGIIQIHFRNSPEFWANMAGREGNMKLCPRCGRRLTFNCVIMN